MADTPAPNAAGDIAALSFEQALAELEKIVVGRDGAVERADPAEFS